MSFDASGAAIAASWGAGAKTMRVLVGYASRFGSTRDIADRIANLVRTNGRDVDLQSVDDISEFDRYDAVAFGSGVYDGAWTTEATELIRRHAAVLARKPLWLFSVGSFGDRHPISETSEARFTAGGAILRSREVSLRPPTTRSTAPTPW